MLSSHSAVEARLAELARQHVDRPWCLLYYVTGLSSLEVHSKSTDAVPPSPPNIPVQIREAVNDGAIEAMNIYARHPEYVSKAVCQARDANYDMREGTWVLMDPFLTVWLRASRPRLTDKKALLALDKLYYEAGGTHFNAQRSFPYKIYRWGPLVLRTLHGLCAACNRMSQTLLEMCSKCKGARYCNVRCQKSHHPVHKRLCRLQAESGVMVASAPATCAAVKGITLRTGMDVPEDHYVYSEFLAPDASQGLPADLVHAALERLAL